MAISIRLVLSLSAVIGALVLAGGCARPGGHVIHRAGGVTISKGDFCGWEGAYRMTNGEVELVVVPQIARIMKYSLVDGENVLWVDAELTPASAAEPAPMEQTAQWLNFGGYKLWIAPEDDWDWPPDWQLDRGPCRTAITAGGSLQLTGMASHQHGVRFDRRITMAPTGTRVEIEQVMQNVSDRPVYGAVWEVTQVPSDCAAFVPLDPGAQYRVTKSESLDEQWSRHEGMLLLKPTGIPGKVFISGGPGWLGSWRKDLIYLKSFSMPEAPTPETEAPREVYTSNIGYIELEVVGAAVTLQPGQKAVTKETWQLAPARMPDTDEGLIATYRETATRLLGE